MSRIRAAAGLCLAAVLLRCGGNEHSEPADLPAADMPAADTPAEAPAQQEAAAAPAAGVYGGSYEVPVPSELAQHASYVVDAIEVRWRGAELELRYELPELLLGEARRLSFRGRSSQTASQGVRSSTSEQYLLDGDDGRATCSGQASVWRCDEVLLDIQLDPDKLDRALSRLVGSEAQGRRAVSERFAVDPIGVLRFDVTP